MATRMKIIHRFAFSVTQGTRTSFYTSIITTRKFHSSSTEGGRTTRSTPQKSTSDTTSSQGFLQQQQKEVEQVCSREARDRAKKSKAHDDGGYGNVSESEATYYECVSEKLAEKQRVKDAFSPESQQDLPFRKNPLHSAADARRDPPQSSKREPTQKEINQTTDHYEREMKQIAKSKKQEESLKVNPKKGLD